MKGRSATVREAAEALAVQALSYIAQDGERLGRFLSLTGLGPAEIRAAARDPGFLAGVLEYLAGDERLLVDFAKEAGHDPATIEAARIALGGSSWEREVP
jgi:hypothetical protein